MIFSLSYSATKRFVPRGRIHNQKASNTLGERMRDVIIVGGGPAGIGAAEALLQLGRSVIILDIGPFAGGMPLELSCKGDIECTRCHVCLPRDAADRIKLAGDLEVRSMTRIQSVAFRDDGLTEIQAEISPRYVRINKCIECGKCAAVCPVTGALIAPPHGALPNVPYIDRSKCAHFSSKKCDLCEKVCPTGAINFKERRKVASFVGRAVLVATGMDPVDPSGLMHYNYGVFPNVVTSLEAERIINQFGELRRPSDGQKPKKLAIIQCAGSRTTKGGGVEYCSKFCCKYGLRIARALVEKDPDVQMQFLYMDLRTFEPRAEAIKWAAGKKNVSLSQGVPGYVQSSGDGNLLVRVISAFEKSIEEAEIDMIILSIGGRPRAETRVIAEMLSLEVDPIGFIPRDNPEKCVFVAGSCKAPMDIEESYVDGRATALTVDGQLGVG